MEEERSESSFQEIVGDSPELRRMLRLAMKAAKSDAPVLILGESGSGKELIARAVHRISVRKNESFVKINCATAVEGSLDRALFGHGNESDAKSGETGPLEAANKGILFLDEIAEFPLDYQAKLLRLLEHREFQLIGGAHSIRVNVRLIASTKYDLGEQVAEEMFLGELYDQLNVFPIGVPPLRDRRDDIPLLTRYFMQKFARRIDKRIESIPAETMSFLMNSDWPGNVRQLENLIQLAVVLTEGPTLNVPLVELQPPDSRTP
ncbi:MAG TPA: sigma 54-interacting transcriptional regulator [Terriglobales bacterium]|nr:sigma 54-interacting transcriptional regulator [Terriglobales bacterium]